MDLETLDDFSRGFAKQLFLVYPDWVSLAKSGRANGADLDHLIVEVPSPAGADLARPLLIHTEDSEVTVGLDYYHAHYFPQSAIPVNTDALAFIAKILNEEISVGSGWDGDRWRGSWTIENGEEPILTSPLHPMTRVRVRSWKGTLDQDIAIP